MSPAVVQIVPTAPGGVHDFAQCLRSEWARENVSSDVLALGRSSVRVTPLHERLAALRSSDTAALSILVHFSGYGYDVRSLCFWLLEELRLARLKLGPGLRIVTMVHELYATGSPLKSGFWLGPLQAHITRSVAQLADAVWTNTSYHGEWLHKTVRPTTPIRIRPVFSTMGEPSTRRPLNDRGQGLVVFGSKATRERALARISSCATELRALGVERVIEAGDGSSSFSTFDLPYEHRGRLDQREVTELLQSHRFALIDYPPIHLGKSTVFAAYAAHGCLVLNTAADGVDAEGLERGRHYVALGNNRSATCRTGHHQIAASATEWYRGHLLSQQASEFLDWLHVMPSSGAVLVPHPIETSECVP